MGRLAWETAAVALVLTAVPLTGKVYLTNLGIVVALHGLPAIGLALLTGFAGQISLGHAAFYGLGAYGAALLTREGGLSPWLSIPLAASMVAVVAWGLGWPIFRLRGHHLAVATLGLGIIIYVAFVELRQWTGGPTGLSGIPPLSMLGRPLDSDFRFYPLAWVTCLAGVLAAHGLIRSPLGLAMRGLRDSERAVASLGIDVAGLKRRIFVLSAIYAAVAGGLYAHYIGFVSPQPFGVTFSVRLIVMIAVGGFMSVWGALLGTAFVTVLGEVLLDLGHWDVIAFGLLLVLVVVGLPGGLPQLLALATARLRARSS
jgi:branched-chain amino acid transport system permease protein